MTSKISEDDWIYVTNKTNLARALDCIRDIVVIGESPIDEDKLNHIEEQLVEMFNEHFRDIQDEQT